MTASPARTGGKQIHFLTAFAIIATAGIWLNLAYYSWFSGALRWAYPDNTFQMVQVSRFSDFYNIVELAGTRDPYDTTHRHAPAPPHMLRTGYPPLTNAVAYAFSRCPIDYTETNTEGVRKGQDLAFWIFVAIPFLGFPALVLCWLKPEMPWLAGFLVVCGFNLSYPMLFGLDRGNFEVLVCPLITVYAWLSNSGSSVRRWTGLVALSLAAALKIYPLIFVLIYLKQRRWREAAWATLLTGVVTLLSYLVFKGSLAENISANLSALREVKFLMANLEWATTHSSGLFSLAFLTLKFGFHSEAGVRWLLAHYAQLLQLFGLGAALVIAFRSLSFARILLAACCIAILVTPESPDYKLMLLFPAVIAVVAEGGGSRIFNLLFVSSFGLLLVAKNWIFIFSDVGYGSIFNPLLVLALLATALFSPSPAEEPAFGFPFRPIRRNP